MSTFSHSFSPISLFAFHLTSTKPTLNVYAAGQLIKNDLQFPCLSSSPASLEDKNLLPQPDT